ncbi:PAS domain-containing protein [Hwanghaeella grinnelliae]|uniref:PAS domain-containing protein n=1 Tax=Hwanghaeella grinnelliae TaxID=2500179 RepID=UPI001386FEAB|nr:PAS domain-containing protein [Hwanghaeella grinnelliae]
MRLSILELRKMPDFSERCLILEDGAAENDPRFTKIRPVLDWWRNSAEKPPSRQQLDPFAFGGALVGYLVMLDALDDGQDFRWRLFGGRHVQEFGADLTNVSLSELIADHPAAEGLMDAMQSVLERRQPVSFEIRYMSKKKILREAVGVLMPLADKNGNPTIIFGAADWVLAK